MDLVQNIYKSVAPADIYKSVAHPNLTYLLISNICYINNVSGIRTTLLSASRADGLVECLQQLIRSSRWLGGMSTTALQNRGPIMNLRRHGL